MTLNTPALNSIIVCAQADNSNKPNPDYFHLLRLADTRPDIWVTRSVAAYLIGVTKGTLEVWACNGKNDLPYEKCSRLARYRIGDIKDYIRNSTITSSKEVV